MSETDLSRLPAFQLRNKIQHREVSAVEAVRAALDRIESLNPKINALCTLAPDVLQQAEAVDRQVARGQFRLLQGIPVGIKDVTETRGLRTTFGSPVYADHVPSIDALVVRRLKAAGAVIMGKTNTPEFAAGGHTFNKVFGITRNPWNPALSAGGSTGGGAAALACGMIGLAQGTDLGGSLRIPASFCGVAGLRPSPGRVPSWPSAYLWDNLQVDGPMARTVEDLALMLDAVAGPSPFVPYSQAPPKGSFLALLSQDPGNLRLIYAPDLARIGIEAEIENLCRASAQSLAGPNVSVAIEDFDLSEGWAAFLALRGLWMVTHQFNRLEKLDQFGPNVSGNVKAGLQVSTRELAAAEQFRSRLWEWFRLFFEDYDALLTPCMAVPPFPAEENYPTEIAGRPMKTYIDWIAPTFILSLSGLPVASIPAGMDSRGLPVGIQIVGPPGREDRVLQIGKRIAETVQMDLPQVSL